ncbi:MAG: hypothetical protein COB04_15830 [Gammaproteobacteria bacterium]|nr:MAG: hypothetical protein COB04_15830 [Gammaproteobacteria bacterium]
MTSILPMLAACSESSRIDALENHLDYIDRISGEKHFFIDSLEYNITQQVFTPHFVGTALVIAEEPMPALSKLQVQYNIVLLKDQLELNGVVEVLLINGEGVMELDVLLPIHDAHQVEVSFSPVTWHPIEKASLSASNIPSVDHSNLEDGNSSGAANTAASSEVD